MNPVSSPERSEKKRSWYAFRQAHTQEALNHDDGMESLSKIEAGFVSPVDCLKSGKASFHSQVSPPVIVSPEGAGDDGSLLLKDRNGGEHEGRTPVADGPGEGEVLEGILGTENHL